jgi:hypothetical protein
MFTHQVAPAYKPRTKLYFGVSGPLWSGALAVAALIAVALYCLLTHRIPL